MKRIFSNAILTTTILGMTTVPVLAAVGHAPHFNVPKSSVYAQYSDVFEGARIFLAQETGGEQDGGNEEGGGQEETSGDDDSDDSDQRFAAAGSSGNAKRITVKLQEGEEFCRLLDAANRIDCLMEVYQSVARGLPNEGDAGTVKRALERAVVKLDRIVRANLDTNVKRIRPKVKSSKVNRTASRPLRAIKKSSIPAANRQAAAVVTELSTVLLRSAGSAQKSNTYYTKIAQAVDSNKVLLRS